MTHTRGPWNVSHDGRTIFASEKGVGVLIRGVEQTIPQIAHIIGNGFAATLEEQQGNTCLIAAAPELLTALDELLSACADGIRRYHAGDSNAIMSNLISATMVQAETAIRKAKGGQ